MNPTVVFVIVGFLALIFIQNSSPNPLTDGDIVISLLSAATCTLAEYLWEKDKS